jgi:hypothetical protein
MIFVVDYPARHTLADVLDTLLADHALPASAG